VAGVLAANVPPLAFFVFDTRAARAGRLPDEWRIKVNRGAPEVRVIDETQGAVIQLKSRRSSFALERAVDIDPERYPYLTWRWKVATLPRGADFRQATTDDQAAQILVAFTDRRILSYLWDSTAPKDTMQSATSIPLLHIFAVVCRSGPAELNQWLSESRNLSDDYQKAYGRRPPRLKGIRLQINTQHTGSSAESYFGDVAFRNAPL
jgi:hypothetical protein